MSEPPPPNGRPPSGPPVPFLKRVKIRNYKSIASCDVELGALTVLVGRNGSGKSNFLDALSFVADAFRVSLDYAIRLRRGADEIVCKANDEMNGFAIELEMDCGGGRLAVYSFEIEAQPHRGFRRNREGLEVRGVDPASYRIENDKIILSQTLYPYPKFEEARPSPPADRLFLERVAYDFEIPHVLIALASMSFYSPNPGVMKAFPGPDKGFVLDRDGANLASVVARIATGYPSVMERIVGYLSSIVPEIVDVKSVTLGPAETLEFWQSVSGSSGPRRFYASSMSDGTLRALGILVAIAQLADGENPVRLVGIEEPETALHPAAAGALMDALQEAAVRTQVVVTTHSPDLLDQIDPETDRLLAVEMRDGVTVIGPINRASREAIQEKLFSPGELLRMDQFQPDWCDLERQRGLHESAEASE